MRLCNMCGILRVCCKVCCLFSIFILQSCVYPVVNTVCAIWFYLLHHCQWHYSVLPMTTKLLSFHSLTPWGRVTHICVSKVTSIGSDNGLSPGRRQAIIWTNAVMLLIRPLTTKFSIILIKIHTFSFKKMHVKMSSAKWRPFCLGLNVLTAQA